MILMCALSLPFFIVSFIWMIDARDEFEVFRDSFESIGLTWQSDAVFELGESSSGFSSLLSVPGAYSEVWHGEWLGTDRGCTCPPGISGRGVRGGTNTGKCGGNETRAGCADLEPLEAKPLDKWISSQQIHVLKIKGTSFYEVYRRISKDGSCEAGYRNCGKKDSISKGFCILDSIPVCPLTTVKSSSAVGFESLAFNGFDLYSAREAQKQPITWLSIEEQEGCFVRTHRAISNGRSKYKVLRGNYKDCLIDEAVQKLDQNIGEKDLFDINGIEYSKLKNYDVSNNYRYKLVYSSPMEWSIDCQDAVQVFRGKIDDLESLHRQFRTLLVLYSVSFAVTGLLWVGQVVVLCKASLGIRRLLFKVALLARLVIFFLVAPSMMIVTIKMKQFQSFFYNVTNLECSTDQNNSHLRIIADNISKNVTSKTVIMISLSYVGMAYECFCYVIFFYKLWNLN